MLSKAKATHSLSQLNLDCSQSTLNVNDCIINCVRYFVYNFGNRKCITEAELCKNVVPKCGRKFALIMQNTRMILHDVYGIVLQQSKGQNGSTTYYHMKNTLDISTFDQPPVIERTDYEDVLLFLILTHIFMSGGKCAEQKLFTFITTLHIDIDNAKFGNVRTYITKTLVKLQYLIVSEDRNTYSWGPRAQTEISMEELLKFVSTVYKCNPKSWTDQYEAAQRPVSV